MPKIVFPIVLLFFICYIVWKIYSVFQENKKLNNSVNELKDKNKSRQDLFSPTKEFGDFKIDEHNQLFKFQGQIQLFKYEELQNFELSVNNKIILFPEESINSYELLLTSLIDIKEINRLDLIFYTNGLNNGKYSYQFIYQPLKTETEECHILLKLVSQIITKLYNVKNHDS